jgi:DNA-binding NtrC family response regulator
MSSAALDTFTGASTAEAPHVLVASDDEWIGRVLDALLGAAGYRTRLCSTSARLLERPHGDGQPCVVLLSLRWPPLNSRAVLEAVAADAALATRHAYVLVTALWDMLPPDYVALLRHLTVPVVPKPFHIEEVLGVVAQAAARLERAVEGRENEGREHTPCSV